jgi:Putative Flp pilus-assembly TadE/G-like
MRGLRRQGSPGPPGSVGPVRSLGRLSGSARPTRSRPLSHSLNARPSRPLRRVRREAERGSAALFVAIFAPAMIFMAGLVIDGGAGLEAKQRASDIAEQAARAGAGQCDVALLRSQGICFVDKGLVPAAVAPYRSSPGVTDFDWVPLADPDHPGQDNGVRVTVTMTFRTTLLGIMPKFKTLTITERADAVAVTGL